jgi:hypothetical protein
MHGASPSAPDRAFVQHQRQTQVGQISQMNAENNKISEMTRPPRQRWTRRPRLSESWFVSAPTGEISAVCLCLSNGDGA